MGELISLAHRLALLPAHERTAIIDSFTPEEQVALHYTWELYARPNQLAPVGDWVTWLILAGRGYGKTRSGAEYIRTRAEANPNAIIALVGATQGDTRDIIVEGESGILAISPPDFRPVFEASKAKLTWPNGAKALLLSGEEPDRARGKQWTDVWADELASWRYPETWDQLMLGLRLGANPRAIVTTTPRPTEIIKELVKDSTTAITRGNTYENKANLAKTFIDKITKKFEGTRLGRQELYAEVLEDNPGALWAHAQIDRLRIKLRDKPKELRRVVVGVDPAVSHNEDSDMTGIVVAATAECRCKVATGGEPEIHGFVLDDRSNIYTPAAWARQVKHTYDDHAADRVVAEVNNGGALVTSNMRTEDAHLPVTEVRASRGKAVRAEPVSALYEQGKVHHVGMFTELEDQMCGWNPQVDDKSPDRMDALVWALTDLMVEEASPSYDGTTPSSERRY